MRKLAALLVMVLVVGVLVVAPAPTPVPAAQAAEETANGYVYCPGGKVNIEIRFKEWGPGTALIDQIWVTGKGSTYVDYPLYQWTVLRQPFSYITYTDRIVSGNSYQTYWTIQTPYTRVQEVYAVANLSWTESLTTSMVVGQYTCRY